ncbi:MAG: hypothetical protein EZS28_018121 [Streblomastix strix]|uniref:PPM-type phosphatase domain-containing protein n=1 Tax=Streblomastix strix TaxID=222440 RepID=A0A5J4VV97_9EUKA|nr:MAG: hypothetical protein EZS28_018121 [Streblomastix strix]
MKFQYNVEQQDFDDDDELYLYDENSPEPPRFLSPPPSSSVRFPIFEYRDDVCIVGKALTVDHKPINDREVDYIKRVGGFLSSERRVNGVLAVARAMGDFDLSPAVSCEPDLFQYSIKRWNGLHIDVEESNDKFTLENKSGNREQINNQKEIIEINDQSTIQTSRSENEAPTPLNFIVLSSSNQETDRTIDNTKNEITERSIDQITNQSESLGDEQNKKILSPSFQNQIPSVQIQQVQKRRKGPVPPNGIRYPCVVEQGLAEQLDQWLTPSVPFLSTLHDAVEIKKTYSAEDACRFIKYEEEQRRQRLYVEQQKNEMEKQPLSAWKLKKDEQINDVQINKEIAGEKNISIDKENSFVEKNIDIHQWEREDVALVMGCDGVFDVIDNQLLAELVCPWMEDGNHDLFNDPVFNDIENDIDINQVNDLYKNLSEKHNEILIGSEGKKRINSKDDQQLLQNCLCHKITKGKLAELAALRLRTAADALDSTDNVSVVVVVL